jgi:hypothetical protein
MRRFSVAANTARMYLMGLADWLCGCRHRKTTMPMTLRPDVIVSGRQSAQEGTYIVCLGCGRHLAYNLRTMSVANRWSGVMEKRMGAIVKPDSEHSIPR